MDALMSMTKEQFMAMDLKDKEEEEQYHKMCENDCCTMLTKDTPIMCYKTDTKEMTLCSTCYWEAGFWEDDENSDNEDEIEAHKEGEGEEELYFCVACGSPESYRLKEPLCKSWQGPCFYGWDCANALCFKMTQM